MNDDPGRRRVIAAIRARMRQQAARGALASVLAKRAANLRREHDEMVEYDAMRHPPRHRLKPPWWKFWARN